MAQLGHSLLWSRRSRCGPVVAARVFKPGCIAEASAEPGPALARPGEPVSEPGPALKAALAKLVRSGRPPVARASVAAPPPVVDVSSMFRIVDIVGPTVPCVVNGGAPVRPFPMERVSLSALIEPVADDLQTLQKNLHAVVGNQNPMLEAAAEQIFGAGGKRMRPALIFLVARATLKLADFEELRPQHRRLAEITEMIHTASLMHDDVLDDSATRRGQKTTHNLFGTKVAVLAGDFMFAQSSWYLANLDNLEVVKLISQVIRDFSSGEIKQAQSLFDCDLTFEDYMEKSYFKTASLIAASARCAAIFSNVSPRVCDQMFDYGKHLGLAFQVVDDILDFTQTSEQLGKPAGSDLANGNLTAPVLFALEKEPRLRALIESRFREPESLEEAIVLIKNAGGIERARVLAQQQGELALYNLECLPQGQVRQSLEGMVGYVLERIF